MTNDDGITAAGLHALCAAMGKLREVSVVAPADDALAVDRGYVSVTPVCFDVTAHGWLEVLNSWQLG